MLFASWQKMGTPAAPYTQGSGKNIRSIRDELIRRFPGSASWGTFDYRKQTGSLFNWSTHAFDGANDWHYANELQRLAACAWLIENSEKLHVQQIVDEGNDRVWQCSPRADGRPAGWVPFDIKGGGTWLHIESTPAGWNDATPIADRLRTIPAPTPTPSPQEDDDMTTARLWKHPKYANVWLIGPSTVHLSPALATSYLGDGVKLIEEAHEQTLKTCLFQCGLVVADLVPA